MEPFSDYVHHPLDETYRVVPEEDALPRAALPEAEWEVRRAVAGMKLLTNEVYGYSFWQRLTKTEGARTAMERLNWIQQKVMELVNSSPEHKAAIRRIVNAMPKEKGGPAALADYIR